MKGRSGVWVRRIVVSSGSPWPPPIARDSASLGFVAVTWMPGRPL